MELNKELHVKFIQNLIKTTTGLEYKLSEHLRLSALYWALTSLDILSQLHVIDREEVISYVKSCKFPNGGYGAHINHDPHLLYTLSAIQIFVLLNEPLDETMDTVNYVVSLQLADGSFSGDESMTEIDSRFSYCAISCLSLLKSLNSIDLNKAAEFLDNCRNADSGFGCVPGSESHAGQIFCCVGALSIIDRLDIVDADSLGWFLCERQLPIGGFNGRPEKKEDVCYSWWVLSVLGILSRVDWIDSEKLTHFILSCQDLELGGISDRPGNFPDVFHLLFGLCGLSILRYPGLKSVDVVYCLPKYVIDRTFNS
jgi:geranylgeranyl transferase type-2 subunit beta